jgi:hypothetical protein
VMRRPGIIAGVIAGLAYLYALFTYETVLLFVPAMVAVVIYTTRSWKRAIPLVIPALIEVAIVLLLRSQVAVTRPAYSISLEPGAVIATFYEQLVAALPFSQWIFRSAFAPGLSTPLIAMCVILVGIPVFFGALRLSERRIDSPRLAPVFVAAFGLWIWLASSALLAVTLRWQQELDLGQGYLAVVYGYFGLALVLAGGWLWGNRRFAAVDGVATRASIVWGRSSAAVIALACTLTAVGNFTIVS